MHDSQETHCTVHVQFLIASNNAYLTPPVWFCLNMHHLIAQKTTPIFRETVKAVNTEGLTVYVGFALATVTFMSPNYAAFKYSKHPPRHDPSQRSHDAVEFVHKNCRYTNYTMKSFDYRITMHTFDS